MWEPLEVSRLGSNGFTMMSWVKVQEADATDRDPVLGTYFMDGSSRWSEGSLERAAQGKGKLWMQDPSAGVTVMQLERDGSWHWAV